MARLRDIIAWLAASIAPTRSYTTMFGTAEVGYWLDDEFELMRVLGIDGTFQSATYLGRSKDELPFEYFKALAWPLMTCSGKREPKDVLFLGGGAFTLPRIMLGAMPSMHADVVEVDPAVIDIARDRFYLREAEAMTDDRGRQRLNVIEGDCFDFVKRTTKGYDCIICDVFAAERLPTTLFDKEWLCACAKRIPSDGIFAINIASAKNGSLDDRANLAIEALGQVFNEVSATDVIDEKFGESINCVIVASGADHRS